MRSERAPKCLLHPPHLACVQTSRWRSARVPPIIEISANIKSPIALAASQCPTSRDFVPWRFLDAGELSVRTVSSLPRPKTSTQGD
jgi:hypothetical protein